MIVFCDGSITGPNPGGRGYTGWVIRNDEGQLVAKHSDDLGVHPKMTNNVAEYGAVLSALLWLSANGYVGEQVQIYTDSQLIVRQLLAVYGCYTQHLVRLRDMVWEVATVFPRVGYIWIPREQNTEADEMSKSLQR